MSTEENAANEEVKRFADTKDGEESLSDCGKGKRLPRVNFRILLFCALGIAFGIFLYSKIRFGGLVVSDFLFISFFLLFTVPAFSKKRALIALGCLIVFACAGALSMHLYTQSYLSGAEAGEYRVTGVVESRARGKSSSTVVLTDLAFDGRRVSGKLQATVDGDQVQFGDVLTFTANVKRNGLPAGTADYVFENDIRYAANRVDAERTGTSGNLLLRLKGNLSDALHAHLGRDEADLGFALLTGDTKSMDGGLKEAVQKGGIAHLFAVSGLHIGIFYAAVLLACKPLGRYASLPALGAALLYSAFCGFTVSSVRAVIMCGALGVNKFFGRKTDLLQSLSFAAVLVLLFLPAQWLSAGFRLSFGAVLGLALFSGSFSRGLKRLRVPAFLADYFAANGAVQLFTMPVLLECFGYFPVWGLLLNFFLIPLMPVLFPLLLVCALLAMAISPAAGFFLRFPGSILSLLSLLFSASDLSFVLTGFALGAGGAVWLAGSVALSERFRLKRAVRGIAACGICLLFCVCVLMENAVFTGCKIETAGGGKEVALVRTRHSAVLVLGGASLASCEDFLASRYGGKLDAVVVLSDDELDGINVGAFLPAKAVYARDEIPTGLQKTEISFAESFSVDGLEFCYESREKLSLTVQGRVVEFDFHNSPALGADLFVETDGAGLKYFFKNGIIKKIG